MEQPHQQPSIIPDANNVNYIPQQRMEVDPMLSKHLDTSEILEQLENMLLGKYWNDKDQEWQPIMITIGYEKDEDGNDVKVMREEQPLMPARTIRIIIGSLRMYLSPNTFLSVLNDERINDIMWEVCQNLAILFYRLRGKIKPEEKAFLDSMIKDSILLGLNRANKKVTLDAISKMQTSVEHIQANPQQEKTPEKEFKLFG